MAGRKSKSSGLLPPTRTLVLDNGGYTLKAGFVTDDDDGDVTTDQNPRVIPNCIARDRLKKLYVASDLDSCADFGETQFRRPVEKGYIVNWEAQKEIWDHEFIRENAPQKCDPSETRLLLAEQPNSLPVLQTNCDQIVFEEYGFASYCRAIGSTFNAYHDIQGLLQTPRDPDTDTTPKVPAEIVLVIDSGYSQTTVMPLLHGRPLHSAVRRLEVGGKLMTNYLTRLLSLRHYDMRNDVYIVNEIKEKACYVSLDFASDLEQTWKGTRGEQREAYRTGGGIAKDYVLPDFHTRSQGIVRDYDPAAHKKSRKLGPHSAAAHPVYSAAAAAAAEAHHEDLLTLRNERFTVPELLFNPFDIGLRQPGLADLVMQSLDELPIGLWPGLLANIVVVGGNASFQGFIERLEKELVKRVPDDCIVRVARPADPVTSTWLGGAKLARHPDLDRQCVTKQEYDEYGAHWVAHKFASGLPIE
ncbi:Actin/actin-like protein [Sodiomyces alkalinus F11]|uniref:Actin-like protein ARP6 n=1 Tax=Sodiomyces alkalinus (strain CBS 110278 / VKM F-3762 / F11) TaxID=1314773 RepID=A0A3N2Q887_SODAK|nr:Actin/actin-like protein [Sodiomyces alkalinus F11]ROT42868.1 Actin/actin-like protein [Sodiomyces alkalinus F11]